jgi:hypothetical protein
MDATQPTPVELGTSLGISPKTVRAFLRRDFPRPDIEHGTRWVLTESQVNAVHEAFRGA